MIKKRIWTQQPQVPVEVDWSNPLNKGLAFALASGGDIDAVSKIKATASASSKKGVSSAGVGVAGTGMAFGSEYVSFGNAGADVFKAAGTLHVLLTIAGNVGSVNRLGVVSKTTTSTFGWALTLIYGAPEFTLYSSASDLHIQSNQTLQNGKTYLVSVTIPSGLPVASGAHIYVNAVDTTTGSPSGTGTSGTDASVLMKVGGGGNSTNDFMGIISYVSLVRREQKPDEIRKVLENPWQIFRAPDSRIFVPTGGTSTATYTIYPTGSLVFNSTTPSIKTNVLPTSGNITYSGTNNIIFSNGATTYTITPSGSISYINSSILKRDRVLYTSGNITYSGSVVTQHTKLLSVSGLITYTGSVNNIKIKIVNPTGKISYTGTNPIYVPGSGTVTTRLPLTGAGN